VGQTVDGVGVGDRGMGGGISRLYRGFFLEGDARCTLVLRCLQEMFRCFVQGRRVQLRLIMSRPQKLLSGIL